MMITMHITFWTFSLPPLRRDTPNFSVAFTTGLGIARARNVMY